jgi:hypothetical protein
MHAHPVPVSTLEREKWGKVMIFFYYNNQQNRPYTNDPMHLDNNNTKE